MILLVNVHLIKRVILEFVIVYSEFQRALLERSGEK